jgi:peptidoglycan hydrolase-like protein with peptidoglycan-binding domain
MPSRRRELSLCGVRPRRFVAAATVGFIFVGILVLAGPARGQGEPAIGALQVGLRARGLYIGPIDGLFGPQTDKAVRRLQRRRGLVVDGIPDSRTRARLGRYGRPSLGSRSLRLGDFGWDVAELQFMLARCGTEPGAVDASYGRETQSAVHRYQRRLRVVRDGVAGAATIARLRQGSGCAAPAGGIAPGVTVSGARLGGLSAQWADAALRSAFAQPLRLAARDHIYLAEPDALAHARFGAALREALVAEPGGQLRLHVHLRLPRIRAYAAWLDETVCRAPVNAQLIGLRALRPELSRARAGCRVDRIALANELAKRLAGLDRSLIRVPIESVPAAITRSTFGPIVVVRRRSHLLDLFDGTRLVRSFRVGTGRSRFPTPLGRFAIVWKARNPWWYPPDSAWAEGLDPIPPGPGNPLGTRWMGLSTSGVGIHGTPDAASVGYSRSHGCIRMYARHAEWLFRRVKVGTPVVIVAA